MKPWRCDDETATVLNITGLLFGHGGEAVEIPFVVLPDNEMRPGLQFGHGGEAVEIYRWDREPFHKKCFNSATAVKPWRSILPA